MTIKIQSTDPDIIGSLPAMRRAALRARQIAIEAGIPLVQWKDGKVVHVYPTAKKPVKKSAKRRNSR
jgi:hypothetical protein